MIREAAQNQRYPDIPRLFSTKGGHAMWMKILQRLFLLCVMMLIVSVAAFLAPVASGGDPARAILMAHTGDPNLDPAAVEALKVELGLDRPMVEQYFVWLGNAVQGDFGKSFASKQPVMGEIARALTVSVTLALSALAIAIAAALPLGTAAAMRPGGRTDGAVTLMIQTLVATPEYWFAPILILVFALHLGVLPSAGWQGPASVVLPAFALSLRPMAYFTQITRASMREVLGAAYITAARARGLSANQTVIRHGVRNGSIPVVTFFTLWFASLLGGAVVIEVIFAIPGMGRLFYEAVINKDLPVLQGAFVSIVGLTIAINTLCDVVCNILNPAMRDAHAR
jgi:peptide/nickel transport system permease protein